MAAADRRVVQQYGALPFSITEKGEIRVLLVTTRRRHDWIIPKGWPIQELTPAATAAREAYEEAGLVGTIAGDEPFGWFHYVKRKNTRRSVTFEVSVFLFAVERQLRKWPEKSERETKWFAPEDAATLVAQTGLADLLLRTMRSDVLPVHAEALGGGRNRVPAGPIAAPPGRRSRRSGKWP
jgi:8-oxo-dGTP pyrophosphatase MutT (NUDIX family)